MIEFVIGALIGAAWTWFVMDLRGLRRETAIYREMSDFLASLRR